MKKNYRKLLAVMLSLIMVMSMSASVFAEGEDEDEGVELTLTSEGMFAPTAAKLVGEGEQTRLLLTYASTSYDKLYLGTALQAVLEADQSKLCVKSEDGVYTIPVGTTTGQFYVAAHSVKNAGWYDRLFTLDVENRTLHTKTTGGAMVPDDYSEEMEEDGSVQTDFSSVAVKRSAVIIEEDGTMRIRMVIGSSKNNYTKLALIDQDSTVEEKEAAAMQGIPTGAAREYMYEFTLDADLIDEPLPLSTYRIKDADGEEEWNNWTDKHFLTVGNSVDIVNQLISQIQVQENVPATPKYILLAKKCWDALDAEEKLEDDGYFSEPTGDASLDDPLNQDEIGEKELLVVSFGTSYNGSRAEDIGGIEKALAAEYSEWSVRRAFTAQIIINHVESRDGEKIDNMTQALDRAVANGVKTLVVQPTHLMHGAEYDELVAALEGYKDKIGTIEVAEPLLGPVGETGTETNPDKEAMAKALVAETVAKSPYESLEAAAADGTAFVYMGHGTAHEAAITYSQMQAQMAALEYTNCFVGTVEGLPEETSLPAVMAAVKSAGYTKIILRPMMVVAGDHANNDMAGDWAEALTNGGEFTPEGEDDPVDLGPGFGEGNVTCQIEGLGRIADIQAMYVAHTTEVIDAVEQKEKDEAEKAKIKKTKVKSFKAAAGKKKVTFSWKKNSVFAGYQLKYKVGKKTKTVTIKSYKTVKKVIKKLKKGKKVSGQIRGFKTVAGEKCYGPWAKSKTVKVK